VFKLLTANLRGFESRRPDFQKWFSLTDLTHFILPVIDRTGCIIPPYKFSVCERNALPETRYPTANSLDDCMDRRANEIYARHKATGKKIVLAYSGGVDSTAVLASLVRNIPLNQLKDILCIAATPESIIENPQLFYQFILPTFELIPAVDMAQYISPTTLLVIGDPGSGNFTGNAPPGANFDEDATVENMCRLRSRDQKINNTRNKTLFHVIDSSSRHFGVPLKSLRDFSWWFFFNFKWQSVDPRWVFRVPAMPREYWFDDMFVFYNTKYFQMWSIVYGRYLSSMKPLQKIFAHSVLGEASHVSNKNKVTSARSLFRGLTLHSVITTDYQPVIVSDPEIYYNQNNSYQE
jgi:hypothetical protein